MIHPRELEILNILWGTYEELSSTDIIIRHGGLTQSTVVYVLNKLLRHELVEVVGEKHCGNVLARTYRPTIRSKTAVLEQVLEKYDTISNIVSVDDIMSAMIEKAAREEKRGVG